MTRDAQPQFIHATTIAVAGRAVVLRGPSGSGKSDLALRLLSLAPSPLTRHAAVALVADDQTVLCVENGSICARAPDQIAGRLEVRGVGIVHWPTCTKAPVVMVVDLVDPKDVPRLPPHASCDLFGLPIPLLRLSAFEASTPYKVLAALAMMDQHRNSVAGGGMD